MDKNKVKSKVINGWFSNLVEFFENILFLGRLNKVWDKVIIQSKIKSLEKILDAGCGTGTIIIDISKKVINDGEYIGIDASKEMISIANKKLKNEKNKSNNIKFIEASIEKLPFESNYFDLVLSCQAIHHLPTKLKKLAFEEIKRVLKPQGRFILCDHGKPYNWFLKILLFPFKWNIFEFQGDNFRGNIPKFLNDTFNNVEELEKFFGWMKIWKSIKK